MLRVWAGFVFGGFVYFVVCVALICDFPDYFVLVFGSWYGIVSDF